MPRLNFVIGDPRMYSKAELAQRHKLPAVLIGDLEPATSQALVTRLKAGGFKIRTVTPRQLQRKRRIVRGMIVGAAIGGVASIVALAAGGAAAGFGGLGLGAAICVGVIGLLRGHRANVSAKRAPLAQLRAAPAALPASDALVAAIASALTAARSPDVRARIEELALLVQRVCDAKAAAGDAASAAEAERVTAPVRPLVELACATAQAIGVIDDQLTPLDEGVIVRALARCDARNEAPALRQDLLAGLDTLRQLEDQRAQLFGRLLEITSLLRAAVAFGLHQTSVLGSADVEVAHALAALDDV